MADQATVNAGQRVQINSPLSEGVIGNIGEFVGDVSTLAELQAKLATADFKIAASRASIPAALIVVGIALVLAALPVALIGASELTAEALKLSNRGWAYLIVAGAAAVVSGLLVWIGLPRFGRSFDAMVNSKEEFARNLAWVKTVLVNSGRMVPQRRR